MEEKELQKVLAFDTLFTTNQLQMLKIIITYLAPSIQKSLAIYIKFMEFQYTLSFFQKHPNAYVQQLPKEEKLDTIKLCDEILPLCNPDEQAKVKQMRSMVNNWEQMQEMLQMLQMMQELFPEQNREVYEKTESYRHIFDVLTDDSRVIEFQHSPLSPGDFRQRTYDYCRRANLKKTPRPIWVFDFSEKDFCLSNKKYDDSIMRMFYWKRASKLFGDYRDYKKESGYELWMQINPYNRGSEIGEQYGYPIYEKKFLNTGFIKVLGAYGDCKTIIGKVYTDDEFKKYITSV